MLQGIPHARNISDDIIVYGKGKNAQKDHDANLRAVFESLRKHNATVNRDKCEFSKPEISFYGSRFSGAGISADETKWQALLKASPPQNAMEVRSFLGMAQYLARFIQNFASISAPIRKLTHQDVP
ncbi:uncharacterized protein [Ptychodera flava]|uniref:uncharacterized protein n=1 Tax=Ptychodera flava TaxID=63121 RepID=UPI00396A1279